MKKITVREALRDAMAEEMRARRQRLPHGRGSRAVPGRLQGQPRACCRSSAQARHRHPDHRARLRRHGRRRGDGRPEADRRVHDLQLRHAGDRPDHQLAAKTLYMSGGQMGCPIVFRGPNGAAARVGAQHSQDYAAWYGHVPGLKVVAPMTPPTPRACSRPPSAIRTRSSSSRTRSSTARASKCRTIEDWVLPIGKAKVEREGHGRHHRRLLDRWSGWR
jgi:pyruvate dehydrogenase E1 component beta subunit